MFRWFSDVIRRFTPPSGRPLGNGNGGGVSSIELDDIRWTQLTLIIFGVTDVLFLLLYSAYGGWKLGSGYGGGLIAWFGLLGTLGAVAFASFAVGGFLGFLFGIPKSNNKAAPGDGQGVQATQHQTPFLPNTNLEEMSDWLTKIILGAGLVGLKDLVSYFKTTMSGTAAKLGEAPFGSLIIAADVVGFAVLGFFTVYLLTRLFLVGAFARAAGGGDQSRGQRDRVAGLNLEAMAGDERVSLRNLLVEDRVNIPYVIPVDLAPDSPELRVLQSLKDRGFIWTADGRPAHPGQTIVLSPAARVNLPRLREAVR